MGPGEYFLKKFNSSLLTIKSSKQNLQQTKFYFFFFLCFVFLIFFLEKISLDSSEEPSAKQTIHVKCQGIFSEK